MPRREGFVIRPLPSFIGHKFQDDTRLRKDAICYWPPFTRTVQFLSIHRGQPRWTGGRVVGEIVINLGTSADEKRISRNAQLKRVFCRSFQVRGRYRVPTLKVQTHDYKNRGPSTVNMRILGSTVIGRRRDSILDSGRMSQALDRCSFNRTTDEGQKRTQANSPKPLFTPVYGCSRNLQESQKVSRTRLLSERSLAPQAFGASAGRAENVYEKRYMRG